MTATDCRGIPVSYPDAEAIAALENAHLLFLTFGGDPLAALNAVIDQHPGFLLAYLFKAGYLTQILETRVRGELLETVSLADKLVVNANERELAHLRAVKSWVNGDVFGATKAWENALDQYPCDLFAMQLIHLTYVLFGEVKGQRDVVANVLDKWNENIDGFEFVLGFYSFGLEENFELERASETAMRSLELRQNSPYAVHTIAHVRDMQGQARQGLAFMYEHCAAWSASEFAVHLWWHTALMHLELQEIDKVIAIYDKHLRNARGDSSRYEEFDATALLWRLKLLEVETGGRWLELADKWEPSASDTIYAFNNVHAMMALASAARTKACKKLLASSEIFIKESSHVTAKALQNVGLPFCSAILDFEHRQFADCVEKLLHARPHLALLGGSYVQRDVLNWTLLEAAIRDGNTELASSLAYERCQSKPTSPQNWLNLAKALNAAGSAESATQASATARTLLSDTKVGTQSP